MGCNSTRLLHYSCKPGDRVRVVGIYRCLPNKRAGFTSGTFRTILIANNIQLLSKEIIPSLSQKDMQRIYTFSRRPDCFDQLAKSIAPSIFGHEFVKQAILCMLLGGNEKVLANGTRLRGDINILLIGDPSVAKSQLLRFAFCLKGDIGLCLLCTDGIFSRHGQKIDHSNLCRHTRGVIYRTVKMNLDKPNVCLLQKYS